MKQNVLVIGASENPERYAFKAIQLLLEHEQNVSAFGLKKGNVGGVEFQTVFPKEQNIDTVTLYVGPQNQGNYIQPIIDLKPKRVIFNPGTENAAFQNKLTASGIAFEEACTLVLLHTNQFDL